ncbi:ComF family protein [Chitinophaga sp. YIM B06452]|uniref:ComF family protein n=1 Tax=Chitinophaga sp. YIM B06452 TaxID=3082158 RepID=UPI0031FE71D6
MLQSFLHLFYPHACEGCGQELSSTEKILCISCSLQLPATGFQKIADNPAEKKFWGRVPMQHAMAGYYFYKQGVLQNLIHSFKYKKREDVAIFLGRQLGLLLRESAWWKEITALVPVPLHAAKARHRGYNQAALLAEGMAGVLECNVWADGLKRTAFSETQTRKSRTDRWTNVENIFAWNRHELKSSPHLLVVDDVMTTGATLEACAQAVLQAGNNVKVSACALACAA